jgi:hypothetical protein
LVCGHLPELFASQTVKILKGRVDWLEERGNRPRLELLVDAIPTRDVMRFDERENLFFAEHDGFCQFFSWRGIGRSAYDSGPAGNVYDLTMRDGSSRTLKGPWSSNSGAMNEAGFGPCMEVSVTEDPAGYARGHTFQAAAVLVPLLRDYANIITVGSGYVWRRGTPHAIEVAFPGTSRFALACTGYAVRYTREGRDQRFWSVPEVLPGGARIENVRAAILAASSAGAHEFSREIAAQYVRYLGVDAYDVLLSLSSFEPAVRLPDGTFWVKPE